MNFIQLALDHPSTLKTHIGFSPLGPSPHSLQIMFSLEKHWPTSVHKQKGWVCPNYIKEVLWGGEGIQELFWFITCTLAEFWKYVLVSLQTQKGKAGPVLSIIQRENLSKLILAKLGSHFYGKFHICCPKLGFFLIQLQSFVLDLLM